MCVNSIDGEPALLHTCVHLAHCSDATTKINHFTSMSIWIICFFVCICGFCVEINPNSKKNIDLTRCCNSECHRLLFFRYRCLAFPGVYKSRISMLFFADCKNKETSDEEKMEKASLQMIWIVSIVVDWKNISSLRLCGHEFRTSDGQSMANRLASFYQIAFTHVEYTKRQMHCGR